MKGGGSQIATPQEKLPSKSPALLGLRKSIIFILQTHLSKGVLKEYAESMEFY